MTQDEARPERRRVVRCVTVTIVFTAGVQTGATEFLQGEEVSAVVAASRGREPVVGPGAGAGARAGQGDSPVQEAKTARHVLHKLLVDCVTVGAARAA